MLTKILNIVDLLGHPTVVIVTVGPAYCCYCYEPTDCCSRSAGAPRQLLGLILGAGPRWLIGFGAGLGAGAATAFFFPMPRSEELAIRSSERGIDT